MAKGAITIKVTGLDGVKEALGELSKGTARGALRRVLLQAGQPMADAASANAPRDTGELAGSVRVGAKTISRVGKKEYAAVMRSGGTKKEAREALIGAKRAAGEESFALVFIGPTKAFDKAASIKRWVQEFGSKQQSGKPYMRTAFDSHKYSTLELIKRLLLPELQKTIDRAKKRAAAKAAKAMRIQ